MNSVITRWAITLMLAGGAALGSMKVVRDQAEPPQKSSKEVVRAPGNANMIARASQMNKISDALQGR